MEKMLNALKNINTEKLVDFLENEYKQLYVDSYYSSKNSSDADIVVTINDDGELKAQILYGCDTTRRMRDLEEVSIHRYTYFNEFEYEAEVENEEEIDNNWIEYMRDNLVVDIKDGAKEQYNILAPQYED